MKKFAALMILLSLGLFTLGCGESTPAKKADTPPAGAPAPGGAAPGGAAPAAPAPAK